MTGPAVGGMPPLVLASASRTRGRLLEAAGVEFVTEPARVDEDAIKAAARADGLPAPEVAVMLAHIKAERISARRPGAFVLGADQLLDADGVWFDKPETPDGLRRQLAALRGREHRLRTAAVIVRDGMRLWHHLAEPRLTMRPFSDDFLDRYVESFADRVVRNVGGYEIEGPGIQLFSKVAGDQSSIMGLPMLPLLEFLRANGIVER